MPIPGYQLSYLTKQEQAELWDIIQSECCTPSLSQAVRLKKLSQKAELTPEAIFDIMSEMKANQRERVRIEVSAIRKYFPRSYTARQMEESIVKMLEELVTNPAKLPEARAAGARRSATGTRKTKAPSVKVRFTDCGVRQTPSV